MWRGNFGRVRGSRCVCGGQRYLAVVVRTVGCRDQEPATGSISPVLKSVLREEDILAILGAIGELSAVGRPHGSSDG